MKLQRTPLILLITALLLGGFVYFYEVQGKPQREEAKTTSEQVFSFQEADVQTLNLTTQAQTLSFVKAPSQPSPSPSAAKQASPSPSTSSTWKMTAPKESPASDASVSYLLNLMAIAKSQQTLTVPSSQRAEFGFDKPLAIVEVKLNDQKTHRLVLGKPNYNRSGLYAQVDPPANPANEMTVQLVSLDFENAVTRPLTEWQSKDAGSSKAPQGKDAPGKQPAADKGTQTKPTPVNKDSEKKSVQPSPQN